MSEYRLVSTKKPTLRLWLIENKKRKVLASTYGKRADLLSEEILPTLQMTEYMAWKDGRKNFHLNEESAIKLLLSMKLSSKVRSWSRLSNYIHVIKNMDRGEVLSWYSLYLKLGQRALSAMRTAYKN